jgi:hypothetical protein
MTLISLALVVLRCTLCSAISLFEPAGREFESLRASPLILNPSISYSALAASNFFVR